MCILNRTLPKNDSRQLRISEESHVGRRDRHGNGSLAGISAQIRLPQHHRTATISDRGRSQRAISMGQMLIALASCLFPSRAKSSKHAEARSSEHSQSVVARTGGPSLGWLRHSQTLVTKRARHPKGPLTLKRHPPQGLSARPGDPRPTFISEEPEKARIGRTHTASTLSSQSARPLPRHWLKVRLASR